MKLISYVFSFKNEEKNLEELVKRVDESVKKLNNYKKLLLNKANFLAISSYIWNNKKLKPLEAIEKLK